MSVAAILLAAGAGRRFGGAKLTLPVGGEALGARVARALLEGGCDEVVAVLGAHSAPVSSALNAALGRAAEIASAESPATRSADRFALRFVANPRWEAGMFTSVKAGLAALRSSPDLIAVTPADLPLLSADDVRRVLAAARQKSECVTVPRCGGKRGHPLVFPAALAARVLDWPDDRRLSDLLRDPDITLCEIDGFGEGVLRDIDTPADAEALPK